MHTLRGKRWVEGKADYPRTYEDLRVEVLAARSLERLSERPGHPALAPLRRILADRFANDADYVSCGIGRVLEGPGRGEIAPGQYVIFVAPSGPACEERLVLSADLLLPLERARLPRLDYGYVLFADRVPADEPKWWSILRNADRPVSPLATQLVLKEAQRLLLETDWSGARRLITSSEQALRTGSKRLAFPLDWTQPAVRQTRNETV